VLSSMSNRTCSVFDVIVASELTGCHRKGGGDSYPQSTFHAVRWDRGLIHEPESVDTTTGVLRGRNANDVRIVQRALFGVKCYIRCEMRREVKAFLFIVRVF
jgi:hypothetical protein